MSMSAAWRKPADAIVLAVATVGTSVSLVVTLGLMKFAPRRNYREDRSKRFTEEDVPPPELRPHGDRIIRVAVFLYRRSWIRRRLHRNMPSRCRFIPSCSEYAILAVRKYGLLRGLVMIGGRFRRCSPAYRGDNVDFP